MLDTIALTLDRHQFEVREPSRFSPSAQGLLTPPYYPLGARGNFLCVQNPTRGDLAAASTASDSLSPKPLRPRTCEANSSSAGVPRLFMPRG